MERLSFLSTFISLIYGLGVANVLAHVSVLIKRGKDADWYWVHSLWSLCLLVGMASFWWVLQGWAKLPVIGYLSYLSMMLIPSILFVMSDLLFPERSASGPVDLKAHYFSIKRPFFILMLVLLTSDLLDSFLKGWQHVLALGPYYWGTQVFWYLSCLYCLRSDNERVHGALALVSLLLFVGGVFNSIAAV